MKKIFKSFYHLIPFKKQLFTLLKWLYHPPHKIYQHLHFNANIKVKVDEDHSFRIRHYGYQIENEIFWNGLFNGWEKVSLSIWTELCRSSHTIVDIGANTGLYALIARSVNSEALIYAAEPVERVFHKLVHNVEMNQYDIKCLKQAISNENGTAVIYDKDTDHTYSVTVNKDLSIHKESSFQVEIETLRLDQLIEEDSIEHIDLIKIDVETHEPEVLEGMGSYLKKFEPTLIIEILNDEVASRIQSLIQGIEYVFYVIDENSGVKKVDSLRKSDYFNFLICKKEVAESLRCLKEFELSYSM